MDKTAQLTKYAHDLDYFKAKLRYYAQNKYEAKWRVKRFPDSQRFYEQSKAAHQALVLYRDYYKETCQKIHELIPYR